MWGSKYVLRDHAATPLPRCGPGSLCRRRSHTAFCDDLDASCSLCFRNITALINLHAGSEVAEQGCFEFLLTLAWQGDNTVVGMLGSTQGQVCSHGFTGLLCEC